MDTVVEKHYLVIFPAHLVAAAARVLALAPRPRLLQVLPGLGQRPLQLHDLLDLDQSEVSTAALDQSEVSSAALDQSEVSTAALDQSEVSIAALDQSQLTCSSRGAATRSWDLDSCILVAL